MKHWHNYNIHHKIWQCNKSWANINEECNKMLIDCLEHNGLNTVFKQKQSPQEQLEHMVNYIWKWTISREAQILFDLLLEMPKERFYDKKLIKNGGKTKR